MPTTPALAALAALTVLPACANLTADQASLVGATGGAAAGLIAANVLEADNEWRVISALAGAAAGTVVAQNRRNNQCAYSRGDGTYYTAACP
jgi:outer membrane lipoprotein SlyB